MTLLLPRVDREQAQPLIGLFKGLDVIEIGERLPVTEIVTTVSDLGGVQIDEARLVAVRNLVVAAAVECGFPQPDVPTADTRAFEARCARLLHEELNISPHEASEEQVWTHLTVCWLMDVAVWRWGSTADERRFRGDINRNAFRRLWWRAEVFGPDFDLAALGEDEFVNLMERPTITSNRRLTRAIASTFLLRIEREPGVDRMMLMRETSKHVRRLTPIVDFGALSDEELAEQIESILDAAATGSPLAPLIASRPAAAPSDCVEVVTAVNVEMTTAEMASDDLPADIAELANVAVGIAQRVGRVTSVTLREAVSSDLETTDARRILQALVDRGELRKRGKTKGTYYVMPGEDGAEAGSVDDLGDPTDGGPEARAEALLGAASIEERAQDAARAELSRSQPPPTRPSDAAPSSARPPVKPKRPGRPAINPAAATQALRRFLGR